MILLAYILLMLGVIKITLMANADVKCSELEIFNESFISDICKYVIISESIIEIFCSIYIICE